MIDFWYHGPVPSHLFRGRQAELDQIQALCRGALRHYLIIYGGRQTGKTSLYYRLPDFLGRQYLICRLDLQKLTGCSPERTYGYIARILARRLGLSPKPPRTLDAVDMTDFLLAGAAGLCRGKLLLLFEELGSLPPETAIALANLLRSWFNGRFDPGSETLGRVMVILAGSIELYNLAAIEVSPLRNVTEAIYLPDLSEVEARRLIVAGLMERDLPPGLAVELGQAVYDLLNGHPYLTQKLGDCLKKLDRPEPDAVAEVGYRLLADDQIIQHMRRILTERALWPVIPDLLAGRVRFSRHYEELAQLELLGLAVERGGYWAVRNRLYRRLLQEWLAAGLHAPEPTV